MQVFGHLLVHAFDLVLTARQGEHCHYHSQFAHACTSRFEGADSSTPGMPRTATKRYTLLRAQMQKGGSFLIPLFRFGRHNWTRTNDPHHVKVVL